MSISSNDNRAFQPPDATTPNAAGGLVSLTARVGEPGSISSFTNPFLTPGGFPACTADLELRTVACAGLVPDAGGYTIGGAPETADSNGSA